MILLKSLLFEQKSDKKLNVLFVGDSQTASDVSYARRLIQSNVVTGKIIAKVGAPMKKIYNMFMSSYDPGKYDIVCLMGGNNDAGNSNPDLNSFTDIIQKVKDSKSKIILITCPSMQYINKNMYPNKYPSADIIPQLQSKLGQEFDIPVIDAYSLFNDPRYFSKDGLHLNAIAHKLIASKLNNIISKISPIEVPKETDDNTEKTNNDIKFGDSNADVQKIQTKLTNLGYSIGAEGIDSIFGIHTEAGVKSFQKNNNLSTTGIVDNETLTVLLSSNAKPSTQKINKQTDDDSTKLSSIAKSFTTSFPVGQVAAASTVVDFLVNKGLTKEQAIGIAANLQAESGFSTSIKGDGGTSIGLAQWHANRMENLKTWTEENGLDYMTATGQLEFLWHELNTTEKSALNAIKSTDTPEDAAYSFTVNFERPADRDIRGKERSAIATSLADKLS